MGAGCEIRNHIDLSEINEETRALLMNQNEQLSERLKIWCEQCGQMHNVPGGAILHKTKSHPRTRDLSGK